MAFCKQCGAQLNPANKFCQKCGAPTAQETYAPPKKSEINFSEIGSKIADAGAKVITNVSERASSAGTTTLAKPQSGFPLIYFALAGMAATFILRFTKIINFMFFFFPEIHDDDDMEYKIGKVTLSNMSKFMKYDGEEAFAVIFGIASALGIIAMLAGLAFLLLPKLTKKNATTLNAIVPMIALVLFVLIQKAITITSCLYVGFKTEEPLYTNNTGVLFYGIAISTFIVLISLLKEYKQNNSKVPANALKKRSNVKVSLSNADSILFWGCFGLVVLTLLCNCLPVYKVNNDEDSLFASLLSSFDELSPKLTSFKIEEISAMIKEYTEMNEDYMALCVIGAFFLRVGPVIAVIGAAKMLVDKLSNNKFSTADALLPAVGIILTVVNKIGSLLIVAIRIGEIKNRFEDEFGFDAEDAEETISDVYGKFGSISFGLILFILVAVIAVIGLIKLSQKIKAEKVKVSQNVQNSFQDSVNTFPYQNPANNYQPAQNFSNTIQ